MQALYWSDVCGFIELQDKKISLIVVPHILANIVYNSLAVGRCSRNSPDLKFVLGAHLKLTLRCLCKHVPFNERLILPCC